MKRPLMMAALNGLYVARMPVPKSPTEEGAKAATDERVRCSLALWKLCRVCKMDLSWIVCAID